MTKEKDSKKIFHELSEKIGNSFCYSTLSDSSTLVPAITESKYNEYKKILKKLDEEFEEKIKQEIENKNRKIDNRLKYEISKDISKYCLSKADAKFLYQLLNKFLAELIKKLYSNKMDTEENKFATYFEAAKLLGLNETEAKYFSAKALDFDRKDIMELTNRHNKNVDILKKNICIKMKSRHGTKEEKDQLIKYLAETIAHDDAMEAARRFFNGGIPEKVEVINQYVENKRIADIVKSDPELLKVIIAKLEGNETVTDIENKSRD